MGVVDFFCLRCCGSVWIFLHGCESGLIFFLVDLGGDGFSNVDVGVSGLFLRECGWSRIFFTWL